MERTIQQRPGKPADDRFFRLCRVLSLAEDQLKSARVVYDSLELKKSRVIAEQQLGAISSLAAKQELKKLGRLFEENFIALLNEEQRKQLWKLKQDGTLGDQWW